MQSDCACVSSSQEISYPIIIIHHVPVDDLFAFFPMDGALKTAYQQPYLPAAV